MLIDTTLIANNPELIKGLLDGTLKRFGSVIRDSATGQIVRHLAESPEFTSKLITLPLSPAWGGASIVLDGTKLVVDAVGHGTTIHKLNRMQQTLSSVLQLNQIAAGASVLNLGVSIAGFAYMGYKLHQLQKSLDTVQQSMQAGFDRVDERFDQLSNQLGYLHLLVEHNRQEQQRLGKKVSELHHLLLLKEIAALQAELIDRDRYPNEPIREALKVSARVRLVLANQATQTAPKFTAEAMLVTDLAIQGWAAATAVETHLLLETGKMQDACELLEAEVPRFRQLVERWATVLLTNQRPHLSTAYRFATPRFERHISRDRVERIVTISPGDITLSSEQAHRKRKDAELEFEMSYSAQFDQQWLHHQLAAAEYLDMLSELCARLEGLEAFAKLCDRSGAQSSHELLPSSTSEPGLYAIWVDGN